MFGDDLTTVFYSTDEFAHEFTLVGSSPVKKFPAILSEVDQELLQDNAVATVREIQYPTAAAALLENDLLSDGTDTWRVLRDGRRINDGAESQAYLVPA
jgi:hypothetical protein